METAPNCRCWGKQDDWRRGRELPRGACPSIPARAPLDWLGAWEGAPACAQRCPPLPHPLPPPALAWSVVSARQRLDRPRDRQGRGPTGHVRGSDAPSRGDAAAVPPVVCLHATPVSGYYTVFGPSFCRMAHWVGSAGGRASVEGGVLSAHACCGQTFMGARPNVGARRFLHVPRVGEEVVAEGDEGGEAAGLQRVARVTAGRPDFVLPWA